ncbi:MAG: hypothetical protein JO102_04715, partial [Elusimicrobia bacterium]|nr:hypothetical protein [Elusimicrobiota bacterium]
MRESAQTFAPGSLGQVGQIHFDLTGALPTGTRLERQIQYEPAPGAPAISNSNWAAARPNELIGIPATAGAATIRFRLVDARTGDPISNQTPNVLGGAIETADGSALSALPDGLRTALAEGTAPQVVVAAPGNVSGTGPVATVRLNTNQAAALGLAAGITSAVVVEAPGSSRAPYVQIQNGAAVTVVSGVQMTAVEGRPGVYRAPVPSSTEHGAIVGIVGLPRGVRTQVFAVGADGSESPVSNNGLHYQGRTGAGYLAANNLPAGTEFLEFRVARGDNPVKLRQPALFVSAAQPVQDPVEAVAPAENIQPVAPAQGEQPASPLSPAAVGALFSSGDPITGTLGRGAATDPNSVLEFVFGPEGSGRLAAFNSAAAFANDILVAPGPNVADVAKPVDEALLPPAGVPTSAGNELASTPFSATLIDQALMALNDDPVLAPAVDGFNSNSPMVTAAAAALADTVAPDAQDFPPGVVTPIGNQEPGGSVTPPTQVTTVIGSAGDIGQGVIVTPGQPTVYVRAFFPTADRTAMYMPINPLDVGATMKIQLSNFQPGDRVRLVLTPEDGSPFFDESRQIVLDFDPAQGQPEIDFKIPAGYKTLAVEYDGNGLTPSNIGARQAVGFISDYTGKPFNSTPIVERTFVSQQALFGGALHPEVQFV